MLDRIRNFLLQPEIITTSERKFDIEDNLRDATAVLLVQAALADGNFGSVERETIKVLLEKHFHLDSKESEEILTTAEQIEKDTNHILTFTQAIKTNYSTEERNEIIEMLWEVAYADGILHDYEAHLLRKIAGLIYVSDRERGESRKRVKKRMNKTK